MTKLKTPLRRRPRRASERPRTGCILGVGPDQNFTYAAHRRPRLAFIVYFRRRNALLHLLHKALWRICRFSPPISSNRPPAAPTAPTCPASTTPDARSGLRGCAVLDAARLDAGIDAVRRYLAAIRRGARRRMARALATIQARLAGPDSAPASSRWRSHPTLAHLIRTPDRDGRPAHFLATETAYQDVRRCSSATGSSRSSATSPGLMTYPASAAGSDGMRRPCRSSTSPTSNSSCFAPGGSPLCREPRRLPLAAGAVLIRSSTREIAHPERVPGDSATTIVLPVDAFLQSASRGEIRGVDDLFRAR